MLSGSTKLSNSTSNKKIQSNSVESSQRRDVKASIGKSIDGILPTHSTTVLNEKKPEHNLEHKKDINQITKVESAVKVSAEMGVDAKKRSFLKLASMAGLGAVAVSMIPKKAEAYVMGATPTSSVVGVKNASNTRVNPATEETLQALVAGQSVSKFTTSLTSSGDVLVPASGQKIRVYSTRFSLTADLTSVGFRFTSGGTDYERYVSPKTGGLYGANNHPNYIEGGVDQAVYCSMSGSATLQINIDYLEV